MRTGSVRRRVRRALLAGATAWAAGAAWGAVSQPAGGSEWAPAVRGYDWEFPRDHWRHDGYSTEWWYFVGFADGADGRRFYYQFTLFRGGLTPSAPDPAPSPWGARYAAMGHAAVADAGTGERVFVQVAHREAPGLAEFGEFGGVGDGEIGSLPGPTGTPDRWRLEFADGAFRFTAGGGRPGFLLDLVAEPTRPPLYHGEGGYSEKSPGGAASLYYSHPRLRVRGRIGLGGSATEVEGSGWLDREFGTTWLTPEQAGWDWFGLTLDDGRDLMLYLLRTADGRLSHADGTLRDAGGEVRRIAAGGMSVEALSSFTPPELGPEGRPYPARWRVRIPAEGLDLLVEPLLADQENRRGPAMPGPDIPYWEGAVRVGAAGEEAGRGFVELTGYRRPFRALGLAPPSAGRRDDSRPAGRVLTSRSGAPRSCSTGR